MFAWILGKVNAKLDGWKESIISKGGKEVLIKSVVPAIPQYALEVLIKSVVQTIHCLCL